METGDTEEVHRSYAPCSEVSSPGTSDSNDSNTETNISELEPQSDVLMHSTMIAETQQSLLSEVSIGSEHDSGLDTSRMR